LQNTPDGKIRTELILDLAAAKSVQIIVASRIEGKISGKTWARKCAQYKPKNNK
jgi:hypothetical protein